VRELLSMTAQQVALRLRATIHRNSAGSIAAQAQWQAQQQSEGNRTRCQFDALALSLIVSSWLFDWEGVAFGDTTPACFDHGCLLPIVAELTPRPRGAGTNVWYSGKQDALEHFVECLTASPGGGELHLNADPVLRVVKADVGVPVTLRSSSYSSS
jgi:hypothetical protein